MPLSVIGVGAGIMGMSTAHALARRGHRVTVLEQDQIPNQRGSSVDHHRLIRYAYGNKAGYTRMVAQAYEAWDRLFAQLGERLYVETGTLDLATTENDAWLTDSIATLEAEGHDVCRLTAEDVARDFPLVDAAHVRHAAYLPTGGVLLAGRIVELLGHVTAGLPGVDILTHHRVVDIDPEQGRVRLDDRRVLAADYVVVAAGPWVVKLLGGYGARVTPSRQVYVNIRPPEELAAAWTRHPMVLDIDPNSGFYVVPPVAGTPMKVGNHTFSLSGDPDESRYPADEEAERVFALCRGRLAAFDRFSLIQAAVNFYTVEPQERFVIEPLWRTARVMTGFSGHSFKFGALMGEAMADALEGRRTADDVARWAAGEAA